MLIKQDKIRCGSCLVVMKDWNHTGPLKMRLQTSAVKYTFLSQFSLNVFKYMSINWCDFVFLQCSHTLSLFQVHFNEAETTSLLKFSMLRIIGFTMKLL